MPASPLYDCAIIGGGIAGLSLSILLSKAGKNVILFEQRTFPFHKVCGEYISTEIVPFLESLGVHFKDWNAPVIDHLLISAPSGLFVKRPLDIGGVGLSRFELDNALFKIAQAHGVTIQLNSKVTAVTQSNAGFQIKTYENEFRARVALGAYGKHSNIDVQLGRDYHAKKDSHLFIAVKYHIQTVFDKGNVEIHNFKGGYCGMSAIENGKTNLSYICKASLLKQQGSIRRLEQHVLSGNPFLKKYFRESQFLFNKPLTISHLYFDIKQPVTNDIMMIGDAAGNIGPLSGNGMSMAVHSAKLACELVVLYLDGALSMTEMGARYDAAYHHHFSKRIKVAKQLTRWLVNPTLTNIAFPFFKLFPFLIDQVSKQIHGEII